MIRFLVVTLLAMAASLPQRSGSERKALDLGYELYSWRNARGDWTFSVLPYTSREKTVKEVFGPKYAVIGTAELKKRMSQLPKDTTVWWMDRLPTGTRPRAKGSEALEMPPTEIVEDVTRDAAARGIKVKLPDSRQK